MKATTNRRASKDTPNAPQKLCLQRPIMYLRFCDRNNVLHFPKLWTVYQNSESCQGQGKAGTAKALDRETQNLFDAEQHAEQTTQEKASYLTGVLLGAVPIGTM